MGNFPTHTLSLLILNSKAVLFHVFISKFNFSSISLGCWKNKFFHKFLSRWPNLCMQNTVLWLQVYALRQARFNTCVYLCMFIYILYMCVFAHVSTQNNFQVVPVHLSFVTIYVWTFNACLTKMEVEYIIYVLSLPRNLPFNMPCHYIFIR